MSKEFTLSNFTFDGPECDQTIDDSTVFEIYEKTYNSDYTLHTPSTVTWGQLRTSHTIIVADDITRIKISVIINNVEYYKELDVDQRVCPAVSREGCFMFTFEADNNDDNLAPYVSIVLPRGWCSIPRSYEFIVYWDAELENSPTSEVSVDAYSTLPPAILCPEATSEEEIWINHTYSGLKNGDRKTIAICGICPALTFRSISPATIINNIPGYSDSLVPVGGIFITEDAPGMGNWTRRPLKIIAINQWGNVGMKAFTRLAAEATDLVSIPFGRIPHPGMVGIESPAYCFYETFKNCSKLELTQNANNLFSNFSEVLGFGRTFEGCSKISDLPFDIFSGCTSAFDFSGCFKNCSNLKPSHYVEGKTYFEDRIYHNGEADYPDPANVGQVFDSTYLNCNGSKAFPVPYWDVFPNYKEPVINNKCYNGFIWGYPENFPNYFANNKILQGYKTDYPNWF